MYHTEPAPLNKDFVLLKSTSFIQIQHLNGAVVSVSDQKSAGLSLIPDEGRRRTAHPAVHPPKQVGRYIVTQGNLGKVNCGKLDVTVTVSQHNRLISTTGSKAQVTGDERPQLRAAIVCAPTLSYHIDITQKLHTISGCSHLVVYLFNIFLVGQCSRLPS